MWETSSIQFYSILETLFYLFGAVLYRYLPDTIVNSQSCSRQWSISNVASPENRAPRHLSMGLSFLLVAKEDLKDPQFFGTSTDDFLGSSLGANCWPTRPTRPTRPTSSGFMAPASHLGGRRNSGTKPKPGQPPPSHAPCVAVRSPELWHDTTRTTARTSSFQSAQ